MKIKDFCYARLNTRVEDRLEYRLVVHREVGMEFYKVPWLVVELERYQEIDQEMYLEPLYLRLMEFMPNGIKKME